LDVKGAFLKGRFASPDEVLMLEVPQGFRWVYDKLGEEMEQRYRASHPMTKEEVKERTKEIFKEWTEIPLSERLRLLKLQKSQRGGSKRVYLQMQRTIYGSVQAARAFWMELQKAFTAMGYTRSAADPCLYFRWDEDGELCVWLTWIDDCIIMGSSHVVDRERIKMMTLFECDDVGPMEEYVGNKIEISEQQMKLTQPVLLQSFADEFGVKASGENLPAKPGQILMKGEEKDVLSAGDQSKYRSGVGKLRYTATWSRPDILNAVREVSRYLQAPTLVHYDAMLRIMDYCLSTASRGRKIAPVDRWDGTKEFEFVVSGASDAAYNQCPDTRKCVSGNTTEVNGVPVITKSVMQDTRKLSVTEAELDSAVTNVQDMLVVRQILESMGLKVKLPMVLRVDNSGVRELVNNWSVGGRTRHVANKAMYLRELKEWGVLKVLYQAGGEMCSDVFTKNLPRPAFEKHTRHYVINILSASGKQEQKQVEQQQGEQQQARESVGFEVKQVQVCDPGNVQLSEYERLWQLVDNKSNG
jgi:Reverse transcriptase (RNA-dependent DNA polymerase)